MIVDEFSNFIHRWKIAAGLYGCGKLTDHPVVAEELRLDCISRLN